MHKVARGDLCPHGHFYTITVHGNYESRPDRMALTLTPGLGPTRARGLVEFFGSVEGVLKATLTELEAAGLPVQAAQSLGTGRSVEFADDERAKASAMGINVVTLDDGAHPPGCVRYMIRRQSYMCEAMSRRFRSQGSRSWARVIPPHTEWAWRSGWAVLYSTRTGNHQRIGTRGGHVRASGRGLGKRESDRGIWHRRGCHLSKGQFAAR